MWLRLLRYSVLESLGLLPVWHGGIFRLRLQLSVGGPAAAWTQGRDVRKLVVT